MGLVGNTAQIVSDLRIQVARLERASGRRAEGKALPFGVPDIDARLPGGGLALGSLHEMASGGPDIEHGGSAALLAAGALARLSGPVLWVLANRDLFAPGLAAVGLHPDRVLVVEAGKEILLVMEEGLRHLGLAGVVGELGGRLSLTASRRLQLAAEQSGVLAIVLRRSRKHDDPALSEPTAALTRWRVSAMPSPPPLAHAPDTPGLGPALWRLDLTRCRGGEPASWIVEACDAQGHLHLAADMANRPSAQAPGRRAVAG